MRFCLVTESTVPEETVRLLREAAEARQVPFETILAKSFDFDPARRLRPGDILYNCATSLAASRTEQFLYADGVATFYAAPRGIFFPAHTQTLVGQFAGVPMPKMVSVSSSAAALLGRHVEALGGFPIVVKVLGRSSGIGVMLAESIASLRSLVDYTIAQGQNPLLLQFIPDAVHWRVIVLGGRAIASYRNKQVADDFRSCGSTDREDFEAVPPEKVLTAALRATEALQLYFAGVDVLEDRAGNAWFLEANCPCYFPHPQLHAGVDIAGQMLDFLLARSRARS